MKPATSMELAPAFVHQAGEYPSAMGIAAAGNRVLLGTGAGELRGLDLGTGALSFQTQAHEGVLLSLAAHPAEPLVATGGQDKRLLVTHADTGAMIFERPAGDGWAEHVAWSPDGSMLLVSAGKRARLFAKNGDPMLESESLPSTIAGIAWSRDAEQFAVACYGGVHVFSVAARQQVKHFAWKGSLISIAWSPDNKVIACGSQDCSVHFWRVKTGKDSQMTGYPFKPRVLGWDARGSQLATGGDSTVTVWDFAGRGPEGSMPTQLKGHRAVLTALAWSPTKGVLASGADDMGILLWEPRKSDKAFAFAFMQDQITSLCWAPNHKALVAADASGAIAAFATT
jgi:WD40 repeat protein